MRPRIPRNRAAPPAALLLGAAAAVLAACGPSEAERERAVAVRLLEIAAGEAQAMRMAVVDTDGDGKGEALSFKELAGLAPPRRSPSGDFEGKVALAFVGNEAGGRVVERGIVHAERGDGLLYRVYLPAAVGDAVLEGIGLEPFSGPVDSETAETCWCAYAWPRGGEGWVWFVNQEGVVLRSSNAGLRYSAADRIPERDAAYLRRAPGGWRAPLATGTLGNDGARWEKVE